MISIPDLEKISRKRLPLITFQSLSIVGTTFVAVASFNSSTTWSTHLFYIGILISIIASTTSIFITAKQDKDLERKIPYMLDAAQRLTERQRELDKMRKISAPQQRALQRVNGTGPNHRS